MERDKMVDLKTAVEKRSEKKSKREKQKIERKAKKRQRGKNVRKEEREVKKVQITQIPSSGDHFEEHFVFIQTDQVEEIIPNKKSFIK